jgi:hypothetical protein
MSGLNLAEPLLSPRKIESQPLRAAPTQFFPIHFCMMDPCPMSGLLLQPPQNPSRSLF